jgi:hypothetical protein
MTYQEGPYMPRRPIARGETSDTGWVIGALAVLLIAGGVMLAVNKSDKMQIAANNTNRPAATQPASPQANPPSTTGSGATSPLLSNR